MAKRKGSKSPIVRSPDQPIVGPASPDPTITPSADGAVDWRDAIPVLPYQWRWIKDDSQLKIAVWSRQSGKSFAAALRAVLKCLEKRTQYIILSKGERQSRLFMEKVKDFCQVFKECKFLPEFAEMETEEKTMEVLFPHNRSRIIGLPANPDTARGYSGHIVLDEFAFHGDAHKIYAACFPIITRGYSIEVISTPNGTAGKFYEIAKQAGLVGSPESQALTPDTGRRTPDSLWSGHKVNIYDAAAQGLPANIDLLRSGCDDEETWLQEYCCQFLSDAQNYLPIELISSCVHEEATTEWAEKLSVVSRPLSVGRDPSFVATDHGPRTTDRDLYLGVDIGRKRDLTIAWLFEKVGGVLWSRRLLVMKGMSFDVQEKEICRLIDGGAGPCPAVSPLLHRPIGHRHDARRAPGAEIRRDG